MRFFFAAVNVILLMPSLFFVLLLSECGSAAVAGGFGYIISADAPRSLLHLRTLLCRCSAYPVGWWWAAETFLGIGE